MILPKGAVQDKPERKWKKVTVNTIIGEYAFYTNRLTQVRFYEKIRNPGLYTFDGDSIICFA
ncbi:MAG: hypothetical protein LBR47_07545 [Spirochaetaceae bacterium]|jgi:hypothetical protein|nr:hypothetical protein [Spirochaetaceae bacterium]